MVSGDAVIRAPAGGSEIVIKTTSRTAGAIESLQWGGKEFLDNADHGRELQTCWNGNAGVEPIADETFNPTEAGSLDDGRGANSSSRLLEIQARGNQLETFSQPAFWLNPGETSGGKPARNKTILSNDRLRKRVVIGCKNLPHAIDCQLTVSLAAEDRNTRCVIEALTGYMPPEFDQFQVFDPKTGKLAPVDDGPGEQALPLVFSTADGKYAMGVFSPGAGGAARWARTHLWPLEDESLSGGEMELRFPSAKPKWLVGRFQLPCLRGRRFAGGCADDPGGPSKDVTIQGKVRD